MRSIPLRPGETFVIGDTSISATCPDLQSQQGAAPKGPISNPTFQRPTTPIQHQSNQQWVADYVREERRLAEGRVR